jgi:hypothetical protein
MRIRVLITIALASALGCSTDDDPSGDELPGAPAAGEWIEVVPGGDTICSRGTDYRFFVRGGRTDRIIIDFEGGGACWNAITCSIADSLFRDATPTLEEIRAGLASGQIGGLFDDDPTRPFSDWTIVHIPYCTGDVHWGNAEQEYMPGLTIQHRGFVNASAALDWVYGRYEAPETLLVSGCSAGAYGAALHSAYIADHYADARIAVLADSGSGIITDDFLTNSLPNWGAEPNLPPFIPSIQVPISELTLPDLYRGIGEHFPRHRFAQTAAAYDADQIFFYTAMGGNAEDWPGLFRASIAEIESGLENFRAFVPPGPMHCVSPYPFFYDREVSGTRLSEWTEQLVLGDAIPDTVACEGAECCDDPVCEACATSDDSWCRFCRDWPFDWSECAGAGP